jgi:hypothetical protein
LEELPETRAVLEAFQSKEIVPWQQFEAQHGEVLQATGIFAHQASDVGKKLWEALKSRVIEHVRGSVLVLLGLCNIVVA